MQIMYFIKCILLYVYNTLNLIYVVIKVTSTSTLSLSKSAIIWLPSSQENRPSKNRRFREKAEERQILVFFVNTAFNKHLRYNTCKSINCMRSKKSIEPFKTDFQKRDKVETPYPPPIRNDVFRPLRTFFGKTSNIEP